MSLSEIPDGRVKIRFVRWIIGDIHGMLRPLRVLVQAVMQLDPTAQFLFVGDYVNRGPDSRGVVDFLLQMPNARFCRGNHDDIFDLLLNGHSHAAGVDPIPVFSWFMAHGLDRTLHSYGLDDAMLQNVARKPTHAKLTELVAEVPETHRRFFRTLPLAIEEPDIFVMHAKWDAEDLDDRPDVLSRVIRDPRMLHKVLWERYSVEELIRKKSWKRRGYFGHTPVANYDLGHDAEPIFQSGIVLLDTAVALGTWGRLTAVCAENDQYLQVDHFGNLLPVESA